MVYKAIYDMVYAGAVSVLLVGRYQRSLVPLNIVPKPHSDMLQLIVNVRNVNEHLISIQVHDGLSAIADIKKKKRDYLISYDLTSGYYYSAVKPDSRRFNGFKSRSTYY
jgi:hypothetical protein